jgi:uncharacterized repeat protein (TIGR01451 family)
VNSTMRRTVTTRATIALVLAVGALAALTATASAAPAPQGSTDLRITKTDSPDPVHIGQTLNYSIGVENLGPLSATGVTVVDNLPKNVDLVSATSSAGPCSSKGHKVTCKLGQVGFGVNYGAPPTVSIAVIPRRAGQITNVATVIGDQKDPSRANNSATATTRVLGAASCQGVPATIVGTPGDDVLTGTGGPDVIVAFAGNDTIRSLGGRDLICAGRGNDVVAAGTAADRVFGAAGRDRLLGRGGPDLLKGGAGGDFLFGNRGNDRLRGGAGFDRCRGGPGRDSIRGCER